MIRKLIFTVASAFTLAACATQQAKVAKISFIEKKPDEIQTSQSLRTFLAKNKSPKVVVRVSQGISKLAESNEYEMVYSTIEKVLLANGFQVRDRKLFDQVFSNKDNATNYENLYKRSDTDLIIEVLDTNPTVKYTTNKYREEGSTEEKTGSYDITKYGSNIEYKVVILKTNEFAGAYKFNFTPCTDGCLYAALVPSKQELMGMQKAYKKGEPTVYAERTVVYDKAAYEDFIKVSTQKLIDAMRSN
ncbi:hypothetical protein SAMN05443429_103191 [Cruoricaptor ignavus]|uniref:Lipoprotein n=1 Tax=Cruoricaptor ignavus TaxID=1118202 RepID=A0A1M6DC38_9FLAO|nr:hypothetical protein [Cruoricaptor ignavus]SHI70749.1 hypothetical protein SAMN05443429_103191 [Cruoricaptor ignavus]